MFDLPQPLGPTTAVMGSGKVNDRPVDEGFEAADLETLDPHDAPGAAGRSAARRVTHDDDMYDVVTYMTLGNTGASGL